MVSRRKILSRSRDDLHLEQPPFQPEDEEDVWYQKDKLFKVSKSKLFSFGVTHWAFFALSMAISYFGQLCWRTQNRKWNLTRAHFLLRPQDILSLNLVRHVEDFSEKDKCKYLGLYVASSFGQTEKINSCTRRRFISFSLFLMVSIKRWPAQPGANKYIII